MRVVLSTQVLGAVDALKSSLASLWAKHRGSPVPFAAADTALPANTTPTDALTPPPSASRLDSSDDTATGGEATPHTGDSPCAVGTPPVRDRPNVDGSPDLAGLAGWPS